MSVLHIKKVLELPDVLDPNCMYLVGDGTMAVSDKDANSVKGLDAQKEVHLEIPNTIPYDTWVDIRITDYDSFINYEVSGRNCKYEVKGDIIRVKTLSLSDVYITVNGLTFKLK